MTSQSPAVRDRSPHQRVADEVRGQLARHRITQTALAQDPRLRLSESAISRRLTGEIPFDVAELAAIAEILGVPMSTFVVDEPEQVPA